MEPKLSCYCLIRLLQWRFKRLKRRLSLTHVFLNDTHTWKLVVRYIVAWWTFTLTKRREVIEYPDGLFNIWTVATKRICPIAKNLAIVGSHFCQILNKTSKMAKYFKTLPSHTDSWKVWIDYFFNPTRALFTHPENSARFKASRSSIKNQFLS